MSKPTTERSTAAEAAEHLPELLARVVAEGARFEVTSGSDVVAEVVPKECARSATSGELDQLLSKLLPPLDPDDAADWEALADGIRREAKVPPNPWE
jgi:antitoxin (DNA-binding transcriptional repressor) of toxin-antitoxin stability system